MKELSINNLCRNWWFLISAVAFAVSSVSHTYAFYTYGYISIIGVIPFAVFVGARYENILKSVLKTGKCFLILSAISAISLSIENQPTLLLSELRDFLSIIQYKTGISTHADFLAFVIIPKLLLPLNAVFYFTVLTKIYTFIENVLKKVIKLFTKKDVIVASLLCAALIVLVAVAFCNADGLSGYYKNGNYIYTADIGRLLKGNCYTSINHLQNDIRQPLFAVLSAPFFAPISFLNQVFPISKRLFGFLIAAMNTILMSFSLLLIGVCTAEEKTRRGIIFMLFGMYATLLFGMVIEQYQVVMFWLVLYMVYCTHVKNEQITKEVLFIATTGTLITNGIVFPLILEDKSIKKIPVLLLKTALMGIAVLCLFGRLGTLLSGYRNVQELLQGFGGAESTFGTRFYKFLTFVSNCFIAPNSYMANGGWRLGEAKKTAVVFGVTVLAICVISFLINNKKLWSRISFGWVVYSFIIVCLIGWGFADNSGPILYILYFGWAYCVMIHLFIDKIFEKIRLKRVGLITEYVLAAVMLLFNISQISVMITKLSI
ncbi:MAG: hypothetical protein J5590_02645 [Clostridia bacterium]|nr:hypothetical protein [Clostridia bacterium]